MAVLEWDGYVYLYLSPAAGNFCPCCVQPPSEGSLCAAPFLTIFCPLIWSASFPSAPCFSPISPSSLPLSCTGGRDAMPCPGAAVTPGSSPHLRLGKGGSRGEGVAPLLEISPGEPGSAPQPSLLLSNLILPCFIAGPLSSVMGKSFQCPGSLLQRQRGRGCSF